MPSHPDINPSLFSRFMITSLANTLVRLVGPERAWAAVEEIGQAFARWMEGAYGMEQEALAPAQFAELLLSLQNRLGGVWHLQQASEKHVVAICQSCPFGELVKSAPSLCAITASLFGWVTARNFGYARVNLKRRIARGDDCCEIDVYLGRTAEAEQAEGSEYTVQTDRRVESSEGLTQRPLQGYIEALKTRIGVLEARVHELEETLEKRKLVERAKGILMERLKLTEAEAMQKLQKVSQDRNKKLAEVAKLVIEANELI